MAPQVTQCPKCHTSFRVTEAQLSIANGAVRCGSCLHIFNAPDHWIGTGGQQPATKTAAPEQKPQERTTPPTKNTDSPRKPQPINPRQSLDEEPEPPFNDTIEQSVLDNIFDDDFVTEESLEQELDAGVTENADSTDDTIDSFDDDDDDMLISDDMGFEDDDDGDNDVRDIKDTGKHPIISSIDEDEELFGAFDDDEDRDNTGDFSESFLEIDNWEKEDKGVFKDLDELGEQSDRNEDDWAKQLLDDEVREDTGKRKPPVKSPTAPPTTTPATPPSKPAAPPTAPVTEADDASEDPFKDIFDELDTEKSAGSLDAELRDILNEREKTPQQKPPVEDEFILGGEPLVAGERIGSEKRALLANIEPEPVVFATTRGRRRWVGLGWTAGIVLALLALGVQYVYFNFNRLARDDRYRDLLADVCKPLGCTIPERDDIQLIRSTNLMVRSHPRIRNALVVDAIITNRANFRQHFPDMEFEFTNLSGNIVAARRFTPSEYLSGEVAGMTMMPIKQPIHVSLELVDPGPSAVNYQMRLLAQRKR